MYELCLAGKVAPWTHHKLDKIIHYCLVHNLEYEILWRGGWLWRHFDLTVEGEEFQLEALQEFAVAIP